MDKRKLEIKNFDFQQGTYNVRKYLFVWITQQCDKINIFLLNYMLYYFYECIYIVHGWALRNQLIAIVGLYVFFEVEEW